MDHHRARSHDIETAATTTNPPPPGRVFFVAQGIIRLTRTVTDNGRARDKARSWCRLLTSGTSTGSAVTVVLPCGPLVEYWFDRIADLEVAVPRGSRFAAGKAPSRNEAGRSLPSDRDMAYVELQIVCGVCFRGNARPPILGAWWIESHHAAFDSAEVNERVNTRVERQLIGDRLRYKLECPRCPAKPVLRGETIDKALEVEYEQGARAKVSQLPL